MRTLRLVVAIIVTVIWSVVWVIAIVSSDYNGVGLVTPVMLLVVGFLFDQEWRDLRRGKAND